MSTKPTKVHLSAVPRREFQGDRGMLVEARCENCHSAPKGITADDYQEWTGTKGYTGAIFCGHCIASLDD